MSTFSTLRAVGDANGWKQPVTVAVTTNVTLSGVQNLSERTCAEYDTVLCAGQTDATENGVYIMVSGSWRRRSDMNASADTIAGCRVPVLAGTYAGSVFYCTNSAAITIGTTSIAWAEDRAVPADATFSPVITMARNQRTEFASTGALIFSIAATGHVEGVEQTISVPAGTASSVTLPSDLNASGDAFDADEDYAIFIVYSGGKFVTSTRSTPALDTTAPTVSSATVTAGNTDALVVAFSKAVYLTSTTGLSLTFTTGTARTITAIESGNGTTSVTLTLSGVISGSDEFTLVYGATNEVHDLNGNALVAGSTAATNTVGDYTIAGMTMRWIGTSGLTYGVSPAVASWAPSTGSGATLVQATAGNQPTATTSGATDKINSVQAVHFDGTDDYLEVTFGTPTDPSAATIALVVDFDGAPNEDCIIWIGTSVAGDPHLGLILYQDGSGMLNFATGSAGNVAQGAFAATGQTSIVCRHDGTKRQLWVNGALLDENLTADNPETLSVMRIGSLPNGNYPFDGLIGEVQFSPTYVADGEIALFTTYAQDRWDTP
jgi:hypothetical protein